MSGGGLGAVVETLLGGGTVVGGAFCAHAAAPNAAAMRITVKGRTTAPIDRVDKHSGRTRMSVTLSDVDTSAETKALRGAPRVGLWSHRASQAASALPSYQSPGRRRYRTEPE